MWDKQNKYAEDLKDKITFIGNRDKLALQLAYCNINKCVYVCVTVSGMRSVTKLIGGGVPT